MRIKFTRELNNSQLSRISKLHYKVLKESFINNFGKNFIKISYKALVKNPQNLVFILEEKGEIYGFMVATLDDAKFTQRVIISYPFALFGEILKSIHKPFLLIKLLSWFFSLTGPSKGSPELKFIAIDPSLQRKGWGKKFILRLKREFKKRGIHRYKVETKAGNKYSNNFYKKQNFTYLYSKTIFGDKFNFYLSPNGKQNSKLPLKNDLGILNIFKKNFQTKFLCIIFLIFLSLFIFKSLTIMTSVPFYDFDEAHRAENAKRMLEYKSFFVPLTGSSQDRIEHLKIPLKENPVLHLYYHLERPFLVYLTMALSVFLFGPYEWAYRLPSFIFGQLILLSHLLFIKIFFKKINFFALTVSFLALVASSDLWLSSQYAQMDTGISLFLSSSLILLIIFCKNRKKIFLKAAGISFALGVLSKGQPAVIIFFPIIYLLVSKKLSFKELLGFIKYSLLLLVPWVAYMIYRFGIEDVIFILPGFAITSASIIDIHQRAPVFWYARWWWESLRPGWTIFMVVFLYDLKTKNIGWEKKALLFFIIGGLLSFSIPPNKIWWYVLPLLPAISLYTYLSLSDYLEKARLKYLNLILVVFIASLPVLMKSSNKVALAYGLIITVLSLIVLKINLSRDSVVLKKYSKLLLSLTVLVSLYFFYFRFPEITPYHWNTKAVAGYYKSLPGKKCLWVYDMPAEAVLFYSNAGEVNVYNDKSVLYGHCQHYLMSASSIKELRILPRLYNNQPIMSQGSMKLFKL